MATLEQILNFRNLTGLVQSVKSGIPNPLADADPRFMNPVSQVRGNKAEYFRVIGTREVAQQVQYGSPARRRELVGVSSVPVTLLHTFESQQWPMTLMDSLTQMTSFQRDEKAQQQAVYQTGIFKKRFANLRIAASLYSLFQGKIFTTSTGLLAPSATTSGVSTATTIDFSIPANNTGNINSTISTTWDQPTAPIMTQLLQIQTIALKTTGYVLEHAFYSDEVPGYIGRNTEAQNFLKLNPAMNQQYLTTACVPNGFAGIKYWHRAGHAFYSDGTTNQPIMPAKRVVLTPAYDPEWFEIMEGSYLVADNVVPQMGASADTILDGLKRTFGMFGYGVLGNNPTTVEQFAGDTFLPVLKVPAAIFQCGVA